MNEALVECYLRLKLVWLCDSFIEVNDFLCLVADTDLFLSS